MSTFKVLKSFGGVISAACGEKIELEEPGAIKDLAEAGFIKEVKGKASPKLAENVKDG